MTMFRRLTVLVGLMLLTHHALAIPLGYRYVGSRVVSEGRHVLWYWNADYFETDPATTTFVARLYARNLEQNEERPFVAVIRCDSRSYRRMGSSDPYETIEDGDPIFAVWRAGCDGAHAISLAARNDRLNGTTTGAAPASQRGCRSARTAAACSAREEQRGNGRAHRRRQSRPAPRRQLHPLRRKPRIPIRRCRDHATPATSPSRSCIATRAAAEAHSTVPRRHAECARTAWARAPRTVCRSTNAAAIRALRSSPARVRWARSFRYSTATAERQAANSGRKAPESVVVHNVATFATVRDANLPVRTFRVDFPTTME